MNAWHRHLPRGSEQSEVELLAGDTLPSVWVSQWREEPQRAVIHDPKLGWVHGQELLDRSEVVARQLGHAGVEAGDRVLLSATSSAELVVAHVAILRLGAVVMPTNGAYRAEEVQHVVSDARPKVAIVEQSEWSEWIHAADPSVVVTSPSVELETGPNIRLDRNC